MPVLQLEDELRMSDIVRRNEEGQSTVSAVDPHTQTTESILSSAVEFQGGSFVYLYFNPASLDTAEVQSAGQSKVFRSFVSATGTFSIHLPYAKSGAGVLA